MERSGFPDTLYLMQSGIAILSPRSQPPLCTQVTVNLGVENINYACIKISYNVYKVSRNPLRSIPETTINGVTSSLSIK